MSSADAGMLSLQKQALEALLSAGNADCRFASVDGNSNAASVFGAAFMNWFNGLPTTLPAVAGKPWNNGGTLSIS